MTRGSSARKLDFRSKSKPGEPVGKAPKSRRPSIRKLENFEAIREKFNCLAMSNQKENDGVSDPVQRGSDELRADIIKLLADREKPIRILKQFASATVISRQMLAGVQNKVALRNQLKDFDTRLDYLYSEWLDSSNVKPDQLETQDDELKPSLIAIKFDESGDVLDNVDIAFKAIKEKYGDKQEVIDYLDFIDKPVKVFSRDPSPVASDKSPSISVAVGKGEEYVRTKFPKLIAEVESRFKSIKEKFSDAENMSENQLNQVSKQLENL